MKTLTPLILLVSFAASAQTLTGAWELKGTESAESRIYAGNFFSVAIYNLEGKQFVGTYGGKYAVSGDQLTETIEFDTRSPERVGTETKSTIKISRDGKKLTVGSNELNRSDDGTPGQLSGAWLITGRFNDKGEIRRSTPGARRTMKILSGTRFQWIAYNVDTKEFFGTGGGAYTTKEGKYTENIEFFSRDNTRVGASLGFEFSLVEGEWHHKGLSSKGEPIHEIWTKREKIGL
jgi:hypothetical protein